MTELGPFGGTQTEAWGINDNGQVVGYSDTSGDAAIHPFLYSNGTTQNLGTLGGSYAEPYGGINDSGQIAGSSRIAGQAIVWHAFTYANGTMKDIGTLGGTNSYANSINNSGQVVGRRIPREMPPNTPLCSATEL